MAPLTIFAVSLVCALVMMIGATGGPRGARPSLAIPGDDMALLVSVPLDAAQELASPFLQLLAQARDTLADFQREAHRVGDVLSPSRR